MIDTRTRTGKAALAAALAAVAIGVIVRAGWLFGWDGVKRIQPGFVAMNPLTAAGIILCGTSLSLFLVAPRFGLERARALRRTARFSALVVLLVGLAGLAGLQSGPLPLAANTILNFLLLSGALVCVDITRRLIRVALESAAVVVGVGSLLTILAYAYDVESFRHFDTFTPMALHTAIAFVLLALAVLLSHTDEGNLAVFAGQTAGGTVGRRLLPAALLVPAVLGGLTQYGEIAGFYHPDFGRAVFAMGNILVFALLVSWTANELSEADVARRRAEEEVWESKRFLRSTLDALSSHVAILDERGTVIEVNDAWIRFARDNNQTVGHGGVGDNYLRVCDAAAGASAAEASAAAAGIRAVVAGRQSEFLLEYPCHAPNERRWFLLRVTRFRGDGPVRVVVAHANVTARKQAEDQLRWNTALLEAQVRSSIDGILVVDEQGRKLLQNQRMTDLLRIPQHIADDRDDGPQVRWVTAIMKDPSRFIERVTYLNAHPDEVSSDEIELKDGTVLDRYSSPVRGHDGHYYGRIWTFHDITTRKRTENALRESDEKFHQLADHITDAFWIRSPDMHEVQYVSPAFERIWGRSVKDLYAHPEQWVTFIVPEDRARVASAFGTLTTDERGVDVEYRITRPDGEIRWVHVRGFQVRDATSTLLRHVGIVTDITEHKRLDQARRESEERFRNFFDLGLIGMAITSPGKGCLAVNDRLCQILGYERSELLQMSWPSFTNPDDLARENAHYDRMLAGVSDGYSMDKRYIRSDGQIVHAAISVKCVRRGDGSIDYVLALVQDTTERNRLQAQLFQSQKLETVGKLAGGVAHEFNSILTAIIGHSEVLLGALPVGSPLRGSAAEIGQAAGRAATLTRQLLAYGRKQMLKPARLDLNAIIANMIPAVRHIVGRDTDVRVVPAADLHVIKADAGQVEQVVMNMAINAKDAMPRGGTLTFETANVSLDEESAQLVPELRPGAYAMLAITDTGVGMTESVTAHLFEPFFTTKKVGQGTGLGLSTCYGIVRQSGGHITVASAPGRGTTFKILLPEAEPEPETSVQRLDAPEMPRGTEVILLVESDPALRDMATTLLRRLGYTVLPAADDVEAGRLRELPDARHIDLVFREGIKPFTPSSLAHRLRTLLDQPRA